MAYDVRTVTFADKPNDPWFVAADACMVLGLAVNPKTGTVAFQPARYPNLTAEDVDQHRVLMNLRGGRVNTSMAVSNLDADELTKLSYVEAKNSGLQIVPAAPTVSSCSA